MTDAELAVEKKIAHEQAAPLTKASQTKNTSESWVAIFAWVAVLIPISYGIWSTLQKAWALFS
jgi:hypothetical protein